MARTNFLFKNTRRVSRQPRGYALLLGILVMSIMITIVLTVSAVLIRQVQSANQLTGAAAALAAADAGVEEALFRSKDTPFSFDQTFASSDPDAADYSVVVTMQPDGSAKIISTGRARGAERAIEITY